MKSINFLQFKFFLDVCIFVFYSQSLNASPTCIVGRYTGTGASLTISGIGFQPDVVIVKAVTNVAGMYIKTSTMAATASREFATTAGMVTNAIDQLNSDGFRLGTNGDVNTSGTTYYFSAFKASSYVLVGTYTGNGTSPKNVTLTGSVQGRFVLALGASGDGGYCYSSQDGSAWAYFYDSGSSNGNGNGTPGAYASGFEANGEGNTNTVTYHYVAWVNTTGFCQIDNYTGNGSTSRNITLTGTTFQPGFMLITYDGLHLVMRNDKYTTDATQDYTAIADASDKIQTFLSNGFQVGANASVNTSSTVYTYLAMGGGSVWILPIELLNFSVHCSLDNSGVNVHWTTASELNNDFFYY